MRGFRIYQRFVEIYLDNGSPLRLFFERDSGKVYCRDKIGSIANIKHTGIFIGSDSHGISYFMHNHVDDSHPTIVTLQEFSKGNTIHLYKVPTIDARTVIENGLNEVIKGERYNALDYNCQSFVNIVCEGMRKSEDVAKLTSQMFVWALIIVGGVAAFRN